MNAHTAISADRIPAVTRALAENAIADSLIDAIRDWQSSNLALAQRYSRNREQCELADRYNMAKLFGELTYSDCEVAEYAAEELRQQFNIDPADGFRAYDAGAMNGDDSWKDLVPEAGARHPLQSTAGMSV